MDLPDVFGPLYEGERSLWRGRSAVAEYAFDQAASMPRWTLPESTEVQVTNQRILYAYTSADTGDVRVTSGELRWLYPQHLRVQPGQVVDGRSAAPQLQLVCGGNDGTFPALVFAGGELSAIADADKLANVIRHAIARFRVDNAANLGLGLDDARELAKMLIGPRFENADGGDGQTVSMIGAVPVPRQASEPLAADEIIAPVGRAPAVPYVQSPALDGTARDDLDRPADLDDRAASVAARIAELVSEELDGPVAPAEYAPRPEDPRYGRPAYGPGPASGAPYESYDSYVSPYGDAAPALGYVDPVSAAPARDLNDLPGADDHGTPLTARAERLRRATARFNSNSARGKASVRQQGSASNHQH